MEPIPQDLKHFLEASIESIDQLEILRVLGESPDRTWDVSTLATEVQTDSSTIATDLTAMRNRGLLTMERRGDDIFARHGPASALADVVVRLLQLYKERPVTLIKMVYARAKDPLRTFAEAFRLRKEEG